jgi:hypothetical protein
MLTDVYIRNKSEQIATFFTIIVNNIFILIFLLLLSRISPVPNDLLVQIPMSTVDTSYLNNPSETNHESIQLRCSSNVGSRSNRRVSMDLSSKGTLSFHNINYTIDGLQKNNLCKNLRPSFIKSKPGKQIINDVSGIFKSGMNAIMGKNSLYTMFFKTRLFISKLF